MKVHQYPDGSHIIDFNRDQLIKIDKEILLMDRPVMLGKPFIGTPAISVDITGHIWFGKCGVPVPGVTAKNRPVIYLNAGKSHVFVIGQFRSMVDASWNDWQTYVTELQTLNLKPSSVFSEAMKDGSGSRRKWLELHVMPKEMMWKIPEEGYRPDLTSKLPAAYIQSPHGIRAQNVYKSLIGQDSLGHIDIDDTRFNREEFNK